MGRIQTGVDRLVELVHQKQKVSVAEAAKLLGVSPAIIQEWADFLSDEGLLEIKYSFSTTYLIERTMTKREMEQKERQLTSQRETFIRKVDTTIATIENETASFENFKKEFKALQKDLDADLSHVEKEFGQLKEYEQLKREVADDLHKGRLKLDEKEREAEAHLQREYKQYYEVMKEAGTEEKHMEAQHARVQQLIASEAKVGTKLTEYMKFLGKLKTRLDEETEQLGLDERSLSKLHKKAKSYHSTLTDLEKKRLQPLEKLHKEHAAKVKDIEKRILTKAHTLQVSQGKATPKAMRQKVGEFFKRKQQIEALLKAIDQDKIELERELRELRKRGEAYDLRKSKLKFEDLEAKLKTVDERKKGLQAHLKKFLHVLK